MSCETASISLETIRRDPYDGVQTAHRPVYRERLSQDLYGTKVPLKSTHGGCLNRMPFASLIAAVMCFIGVILFSTMMGWGFNATVEQTRRALKLEDWPWLDKVQISFVVLTVLMSIFALFFLAVGFTATGATRENMYRDKKSKCGGRCACAVCMAWTLALIVAWLIIMSIVSMICCAYFVFDSNCRTFTTFTDHDCMDVSLMEPLVRKISRVERNLCGGDLQQFCALTATAKSWYIVGWVGSCIVLLGLAVFFAVHSANYAHVGTASKYIELRELLAEPVVPAPPSFPPPSRYELEYPDSAAPPPRREEYRNGSGKHAPSSVSSSRFAEHMSDSVSQYQYNRKRYAHECMTTSPGTQSTETEAQTVSENLNKILELFSQLTPKSSELPSLLEDSTVVLEELQAVLQIVSDETQTVRTTVFSVEEQFERLESLWEKIDTAAEFVGQKKRQLSELEKLLRTRSGAGRRSIEQQRPPAKELAPIASVEEQSDDDDAPMETTSKKVTVGADIELVEEEPEEKSLFEQIQEQKKEEEEQKKQKTRRVKKKKLGQGEFAVKVKKSEFKVVALDKGMKSTLEPVHNYKAELLATRTANSRVRGNADTAAVRSKWIGK